MLPWLKSNDLTFPALESARKSPNGLLAAGGDLSVERLIKAYRHGCFPWFDSQQPIFWWSPDPRTVILPDQFHLARSLRKKIRQQHFQVTLNKNFQQVIEGCAEPRAAEGETWITEEMQAAYLALHQQGFAHSIEVWQQQQLVGGLYGIAMGKLFFGESMFSRQTDSSKVGFATLVSHLLAHDFKLIDCQVHTDHLASFGAQSIARAQFADFLANYADQSSSMDWSARDLEFVMDE